MEKKILIVLMVLGLGLGSCSTSTEAHDPAPEGRADQSGENDTAAASQRESGQSMEIH